MICYIFKEELWYLNNAWKPVAIEHFVGASDVIHSVVSILLMYISFIAWQQPRVTIYGCHGYCLSNMHLLIKRVHLWGFQERFPGFWYIELLLLVIQWIRDKISVLYPGNAMQKVFSKFQYCPVFLWNKLRSIHCF